MKFSQYNYVVEMDYGLLVYNTRNAKYIQIYKESEIEKFKQLLNNSALDSNDDMVNALYKRGYIVDDNVDEYEEVKKEITDYYNNDKLLNIMLYVTENCNFRCTYCFEKHLDRKFSKDNWNSLYKYIENSVKAGKYNIIRVCFFGGEPLLEVKSIIEFLDKLLILSKEYPNINFSHEMVTNGYLLTPDVYERLKEHKLCRYQITLDGFAEDHNNLRPLAGGGGSWDKIVKNLEYINKQNDDVFVTLRTNIGKSNIKNIDEFCDWLKQKFDDKKFDIDANFVGKMSDNVDDSLVVTSKDINITDNILRSTQPAWNVLRRLEQACQFARKGFYTISVDGKIRKCEQSYNDAFDSVGELINGELVFNTDMSEWYDEPENEYCKDCKMYPLCGSRACPDKRVHLGNNIACYNFDFEKEEFILGRADSFMKTVLMSIFHTLKK